MRVFLIISLLIMLAVDIGVAAQVEKYEIDTYSNYHQKDKYQSPTLQGPFIIGAKDAILWFLGFAERNDKAITALSTLGIFIFTVILAIATHQLRIIADRQIESQIQMERPWLIIDAAKVRRPDQPPPIANYWYVSFRWRNVGRAPAIVEECVVKIVALDELPAIPDYTKASPLVCNRTVRAGSTCMTGEVGPDPKSFFKNEKPLRIIIFGRLTYKSLSGATHYTGFAEEISTYLPCYGGYTNKAYQYET